jgi:uncharacterized protein
MVRWLGLLGLAYVALIMAVYLRQQDLLYIPDPAPPEPSQLRALGLQFWPEHSAIAQRGFIDATPPLQPKGTILLCHGNAGAAWNRAYYVEALRPLGYRVILVEYPGYGGRPGKPSEPVLVEDVRQTLLKVHQEFGGPIYLWGESLGAGVAAAVTAQSPVPTDGLVLLTPWDTLPMVAQSLYWYLPARWLVKDQYNSIQNLARFRKPIALLIAEQDEVIAPQRGLALFASLQAPKRLWVFRQAGHNTWPSETGAGWWQEVVHFLFSQA